MSKILGLITARGGSKGLPGKNIKALGGKPLIAWTILAALESQSFDRVVVSTDDAVIAETGKGWGAEVPFLRPVELAQDSSPHILSSEHALMWLKEHEGYLPEWVMLLQPTSPFRSASDIRASIKLGKSDGVEAVVSVCEVKHHPFLTYRLNPDNRLVPFMEYNLKYTRRQDLPEAFATNGAIYLNRTASLLKNRKYVPVGTLPYVMAVERSFEIDTACDFSIAECLMRQKQGKEASVEENQD